MGFIVAIILGGFVGWLAARLLGRDEGVLMSIVIGIIGSFLGGLVSRLFTGADNAILAFSWVGLFWSFIGALILVGLMNMMQRPHHNI